ncbi:MAG: Gfo/Idh/MocA family oxidoreductase, partial [Halobacteriaceae archaeon]
DTGVDTELTAILEYSDGATAQISSNFDTPEKQSYHIEATNGWLEVEEAFAVRSDRVSLTYHVNGRTVNEEFESTNQYRLEIEEFVSAITEDRDPETGPSEAIANMELIDTLYESANKERPITVT